MTQPSPREVRIVWKDGHESVRSGCPDTAGAAQGRACRPTPPTARARAGRRSRPFADRHARPLRPWWPPRGPRAIRVGGRKKGSSQWVSGPCHALSQLGVTACHSSPGSTPDTPRDEYSHGSPCPDRGSCRPAAPPVLGAKSTCHGRSACAAGGAAPPCATRRHPLRDVNSSDGVRRRQWCSRRV